MVLGGCFDDRVTIVANCKFILHVGDVPIGHGKFSKLVAHCNPIALIDEASIAGDLVQLCRHNGFKEIVETVEVCHHFVEVGG